MFNGITYFRGYEEKHGLELWRTDATTAGTKLMKDINSQISSGTPASSSPRSFMVFNGLLLFTATDGFLEADNGLWRTDGTEAGTIKLRGNIDVSNGLEREGWYLFNGKLVGLGNDGLVETDGTPEGTRLLVADAASNSLVATTQRLYWLSGSAAAGGAGVRSWDGLTVRNEAGATDLWPTAPALISSFGYGIRFSYYRNVGGLPVFQLVQIAPRENVVRPYQEQFPNDDDNDQIEFHGMKFYNGAQSSLWQVGATPAEDVLIHDIDKGSLAVAGDKLFFKTDTQLWTSDGTPEGTVLVRDLAPQHVSHMLGTDGDLFFTVSDDDNHSMQPWRSDGTPLGTVQVAHFSPRLTVNYPLVGLARHESSILVGARDRLWLIDTGPKAPRPSSTLFSPFEIEAGDVPLEELL
jgi:ELWxxDGT repeat protein